MTSSTTRPTAVEGPHAIPATHSSLSDSSSDPRWHTHIAPNTSLELALYSLGKQGQPITVKSALSAYLQIIGFHDHPSLLDPSAKHKAGFAAKSGHPYKDVTAQDLLATFEHALDKHPMPVVARPKRKKRKAKLTDGEVSTRRPVRKRGPKPRDPNAATTSTCCYNRPYIPEVDQLRYEYYAAKRQSVPGCLCGKCGVPLDASGQPILDDFPPELERFRPYMDTTGAVEVDPRHVPQLERFLTQKGADMTKPILVDTHVGYVRTIDENTPVGDLFPYGVHPGGRSTRGQAGYVDVALTFAPDAVRNAKTKKGFVATKSQSPWSTNSSDTDSSTLSPRATNIRLKS